MAGCALVIAFAFIAGGGRVVAADARLALAAASRAPSATSPACAPACAWVPSAICWVLAVSPPLSLPAMLFTAPAAAVLQAATPAAWAGFAYVAVFSMWLGFFAWYRGLALGGVLRVSQVQPAQPFIALLAAVPLLGEVLEPLTVGFALAAAVSSAECAGGQHARAGYRSASAITVWRPATAMPKAFDGSARQIEIEDDMLACCPRLRLRRSSRLRCSAFQLSARGRGARPCSNSSTIRDPAATEPMAWISLLLLRLLGRYLPAC
ncbi:MAG: DMT family transporter [Rubrivivax sp.]